MPTRKGVVRKKQTEWGNTLKLEASFAIDRILAQLLQFTRKAPKSTMLVAQLRTVAKILRVSALGNVKEEGLQIIRIQKFAEPEEDDDGVLRRKIIERKEHDTIH